VSMTNFMWLLAHELDLQVDIVRRGKQYPCKDMICAVVQVKR